MPAQRDLCERRTPPLWTWLCLAGDNGARARAHLTVKRTNAPPNLVLTPPHAPTPPDTTGTPQCIRVDSRPINQSLGSYLLNDYITGGKGAAGFAARSVADTLLGSDVAGNLATTLKAYAAGGAPKLKAEAGQLAQLLVVLSQQRTGDMGLDIYPGRRHAMPVGRYIWSGWAGSPPVSAGGGAGGGRLWGAGRGKGRPGRVRARRERGALRTPAPLMADPLRIARAAAGPRRMNQRHNS